MTKTIPKIVFLSAILLTTTLFAAIQPVDVHAAKAKGTYLLDTGSKKVCGDRLCSEPAPAPAPKQEEEKKEETKPEKKMEEQAPKTAKPEDKKTESMKEGEKMQPRAPEQQMKMEHKMKTKSGTITSVQDPGIGHESHQLAIILPPSENVYSGHLAYSASEPIQLVALHGPLSMEDDMGQPTWSPDGKTKFALTFVDDKMNMGTWQFSGNALAVHTMKTDTFTVSYSVNYKEMMPSEKVMSKTIKSMQDPGLGHETHQLAIILPPSDKIYSGHLTYGASESVQLVSLTGPLAEGEDMGQPIWTPDGETKFALTFIDKNKSAGTWQFSGNAVALHTMKETPFVASYTVVVHGTE